MVMAMATLALRVATIRPLLVGPPNRHFRAVCVAVNMAILIETPLLPSAGPIDVGIVAVEALLWFAMDTLIP